MRLSFFLILVLNLASGCSTIKGLWGGGGDQEPDPKEQVDRDKVDAATNRELELKLAKLWAKVDELEQHQMQQRQRVRILEKGLMLGIIPEELKHDAELALKDHADDRAEPLLIEKPGRGPAVSPPPPEMMNVAPQPESSSQVNREEVIREAQAAFEKGRYGRAITLYSQLENEPGNNQDYWIALCWFRLKEYETSHKMFTQFVQSNPDSPWIARAKYNLARVEYELGYRERAVNQMREVITKYPNEDAAQMARASIQSWERSL